MKRELQTVLQAGAEEEKKTEEKQERLKRKFGISEKNVVIVERTNTCKFLIKTIGTILHFLATIAFIALALVGLAALFYTGPRGELQLILEEVVEEIQRMIPIGMNIP